VKWLRRGGRLYIWRMTEVIFSVLMNLLLASALVAFVFYGIRLVLNTADREEIFLRSAMALCGALVVLVIQLGGVTFAQTLVQALNRGSLLMLVAAAIVPAALGAGLSHYVSAQKQSDNKSIRIMAFVGTLTATAFVLLYATAVDASSFRPSPAVIPNVFFVVGLIFYRALSDTGPRGRARR
jgi:hypothetical protein